MKNSFLLFAFFSTISIVLTQLPAGSSSFQVISAVNNKPIEVSTYVPAGTTPTSTIVIVMHGAGDNGVGMRNAWINLSNQYKFIILAPYFGTDWWGTYQLAGLDGPTSDYEIDSLDIVFNEATKRLNSRYIGFFEKFLLIS
uniref:Phospholipase/carboxylesterase/thioesterase domain-containing protein n=1 Tax=Panagrolaimus sp. ES5 TaxID=591445 RepID=A0AC34G736_9BILA